LSVHVSCTAATPPPRPITVAPTPDAAADNALVVPRAGGGDKTAKGAAPAGPIQAARAQGFAVIADEAHSSQAGESAAKLKAVLSPEELKAVKDGGEVSMDDLFAAQMATRTALKNITCTARVISTEHSTPPSWHSPSTCWPAG
jgi:hypothetical protein